MSSAIRLPLSGVAKRLLPAFLSSELSVLKLSSSKKIFNNCSQQFTKLNTEPHGLSYSTMPKFFKLEQPSKVISPNLLCPPVRKLSFSVGIALGPLHIANISKRETPNKWFLLTIDKKQNKSMYSTKSRSFSSAEKPPTQSSNLADEIMQSKLKDTLQEKQPNTEETSKNNDKGPQPMSTWQKRGYMAFAIFLGGALVVNAVLFCK